jgi:hypothetical protein
MIHEIQGNSVLALLVVQAADSHPRLSFDLNRLISDFGSLLHSLIWLAISILIRFASQVLLAAGNSKRHLFRDIIVLPFRGCWLNFHLVVAAPNLAATIKV